MEKRSSHWGRVRSGKEGAASQGIPMHQHASEKTIMQKQEYMLTSNRLIQNYVESNWFSEEAFYVTGG